MKLYEIKENIDEIIKKYTDVDTGEFSEEGMEQLEQLNEDFDEKASNIVRYIQDLKGDVAKAKEEEKRIATLRKSREKKAESLHKYLCLSMNNAKIEKRDLGFAKLSFRASKSVEILDEKLIPDKFVKIEKKPIKSEIKKFLEINPVCKFAVIVNKKSLNIK